MRDLGRRMCASLCAFTVLSCGSSGLVKPHRVARQDHAGSAYVTVLSIAPWDDYVDALQPKFTLSVDDALAKAIPNTRDEDERFLQSISAAFKVSTPAVTTSTTSVTKPGDTGPTTTTTDKTGADITHDQNVDTTTLPTGTEALKTSLDKEPMLQYLVATALYQEVQLLNRYVKDAAKRQNLVPYVLRMQVTLMPMARNEPYDAYSNISFFYGPPVPRDVASPDKKKIALRTQDWKLKPKNSDEVVAFDGELPCKHVPTPVIAPLLVTDNLEGAIHGQTSEYVRQFLASVLLMQADYSGQATARFRTDMARQVLGRDINSLLTVARVNDSTLRVRLGAVQAPTGSYAMVPQTHNVTILLMVPDPSSLTAPCDKERTIRFVSKTSFVDANTGATLPERDAVTQGQLITEIGQRLDEYGVKVKWTPIQEMRAYYVDLALFAATNNRQSFHVVFGKLLDRDNRNDCTNPDGAGLFHPCLSPFARDTLEDVVWSELVNLATGGPYHVGTVELPTVKPPAFTSLYDILLADDGKTSATTSIVGCSKLVKGYVTAQLDVTSGTMTRTIMPVSVDVGAAGDSIKITFPTPTKFFTAQEAKAADYALTLKYPENPRKKYDSTDLANLTFPKEKIKYLAADPDQPAADKPVTMLISSTTVRAVDGHGTLSIEFRRKADAPDKVRFDVVGGDIETITADTGTLRNGRMVAASGIVTLVLRNLLNGVALTIVTSKLDDDGNVVSQIEPKTVPVHDEPGVITKRTN